VYAAAQSTFDAVQVITGLSLDGAKEGEFETNAIEDGKVGGGEVRISAADVRFDHDLRDGVDFDVAKRGGQLAGAQAVTETIARGGCFARVRDRSAGFGSIETGSLDLLFGTHGICCDLGIAREKCGPGGERAWLLKLKEK
jgi:hypothetical protein